jgi:hypothetical protein
VSETFDHMDITAMDIPCVTLAGHMDKMHCFNEDWQMCDTRLHSDSDMLCQGFSSWGSSSDTADVGMPIHSYNAYKGIVHVWTITPVRESSPGNLCLKR